MCILFCGPQLKQMICLCYSIGRQKSNNKPIIYIVIILIITCLWFQFDTGVGWSQSKTFTFFIFSIHFFFYKLFGKIHLYKTNNFWKTSNKNLSLCEIFTYMFYLSDKSWDINKLFVIFLIIGGHLTLWPEFELALNVVPLRQHDNP